MIAGQRYVGELQIRFAGAREAANQYLPQARTLMGTVLIDAERHGLNLHSMRQELQDGTLLIAEKIGEQKRVTIIPPEAQAPPPELQPPDDFVVWARDATLPSGIDEDFPQQILQATVAAGVRWKTYFFNSETAGHDAFAGDKGTYGGLFPEGLRHAGNVDWESKGKHRLSWYGPSSRYWPDAYVQPSAQFGKQVFMLGEPVLDTEAYATDSDEQEHGPDRYILGAALKAIDGATWLYTVQSEAVTEPTPGGEIYVASFATACCPYARQDSAGGMYRYAVLKETDEAGVTRYVVTPNSRELLADLADNHAEPWFFNQSCSVAHCYVLPSDGWYRHIRYWDTEDDPGWSYHEPETGQVFRQALIDEDGAVVINDSVLSVSPSGPAVRCATDYRGDEAVHATVSNLTSTTYPELEERKGSVQWSVAGFEFRSGGGSREQLAMDPLPPNEGGFLTAHIVFADLRTDVLVLMTHYQTTLQGTKRLEVYRAGVRVHEELATPNANPVWSMLGLPMGIAEWAGAPGPPAPAPWRALPPYYFLYGVMVFLGFSTVPSTSNPPEVWEVEIYPCGLNTGFAWAPYPSARYFGATPFPGIRWIDPLMRVSSIAPGGFQGNAQDFDDHDSVFGCASTKDAVVLSGWRPASSSAVNPSAFVGNASFHYATDSTLPALTGVGGQFARYHPVWLLGKPPRAA
ncbi:MAG TPA: hypothetical protein VGE09_06245 [Pseudoxanthomonas sp.]